MQRAQFVNEILADIVTCADLIINNSIPQAYDKKIIDHMDDLKNEITIVYLKILNTDEECCMNEHLNALRDLVKSYERLLNNDC